MEKVSEKSSLLGSKELNQYRDNSMQLIKAWEEMAANGIQSEEELNKLRLSNLTRLGTLRKEQEKQILDTLIAANKKAIDLRVEEEQKAVDNALSLEIKKARAVALAEKKARTGNNRSKLTKDEIKAIEDRLNKEFEERKKRIKAQGEWEKKNKEKATKQEAAKTKRDKQKEGQKYAADQMNTLLGKGASFSERKDAFKNIFTGGGKVNEDGTISPSKIANLAAGLSAASGALGNFAAKLEEKIDSIAEKKSAVDTRLQGLNRNTGGFFGGDSYWDNISSNITGIAGVSPLLKQSALVERVSTMVGQGIAFNVEQRALLQEMSGKIATTFDAANGTLLRLIKIQQQDTTAGRLGMESALTAFLNNMYSTTEYMQSLAKSVKGSLEEAMSLMTGENALSFEYQIQKWLGSLSSVGMSDGAVQGLAGVLGGVAAGKLDGITSGGQGNLVIMAANQAGLNMSDLLNNGLDETTTNTLMNSMVDYLAKLYSDAGNSKVIQQQIANVYGLSASDLKAAVNLSKSRTVVARDGLDYDSAMERLYSMADTMYKRTSIAEMMTTLWDNVEYGLSDGIASNPVVYGIYKAGKLLKDLTGGIDFGLPLVMGNGMPISFNIADLMLTGALAGGALGSMGKLITSGGGGGFTGRGMLKAVGLTGNQISVVTRGNGSGLSTMGGMTVSESGSMVGNSSSDDVTNKTMTDQTDSTKSETASAVDESDETKLKDVDNHVITIIEILRNISDGNSILKVAVEGGVRVTEMPPQL